MAWLRLRSVLLLTTAGWRRPRASPPPRAGPMPFEVGVRCVPPSSDRTLGSVPRRGARDNRSVGGNRGRTSSPPIGGGRNRYRSGAFVHEARRGTAAKLRSSAAGAHDRDLRPAP